MAFDLFKEKGTPVSKQGFTWKDLVRSPLSKLDCDAFTRIRVILLNGIELEAVRFSHAFARMNRDLQGHLALLRRVEHHQATLINWLLPADMSPLETTLAYEQLAIEGTAAVAQSEPDGNLAQVYRFGLLEDFDHLYRFSALIDRLEGKDANNILQSYTDILPGRPTSEHHRHPFDDLRICYDRKNVEPLSKMHALTILSAEQQTHNYYMNIGPQFSDPVARMLYAEIASVEEQHVTQYESIIDPEESWMEKWLLHEANEVYNYYGCVEQETDPRLQSIWQRFLDYEIGHFHYVADLFKELENRDPAEVVPTHLPKPISFASQRAFVRETLVAEAHLRADGHRFVTADKEPQRSLHYRQHLNKQGSPSEAITKNYHWQPGGELAKLGEPGPVDPLGGIQ